MQGYGNLLPKIFSRRIARPGGNITLTLPKIVFQDDIECAHAVTPPDFLAFFVGPAMVSDSDLMTERVMRMDRISTRRSTTKLLIPRRY
jgi:hypothetical protein